MSEYENNSLSTKSNKNFNYYFFIFVLLIIGMSIYLLSDKNNIKRTQTQVPRRISSDLKNEVLQIGKETIYKQQFDYEISQYPPVKDVDVEKIIIDKMITDSVILQEGEKAGIITLNETIFNSPLINYPLRVQTISDLERDFNKKSDAIIGTVISIWFFNNDIPGPLGYDRGRQIALEKITDIHNKVKSKQISITQAVTEIKNDKNLLNADPQYVINASFDFRVEKNGKISSDEKLDEAIWKLKTGEVTEIFTGNSGIESGNQDALFHFGYLKERVEHPSDLTYAQWLTSVKKEYDVKYY